MSGLQRKVIDTLGIPQGTMTVLNVHDYTPWYRRLGFHCPELVEALPGTPAEWLRLLVPNPEKGSEAISQRGYTVLNTRREEGTFDIDFLLHTPSGPASRWANRAKPGDTIDAALTPSGKHPPAGVEQLLLGGDLTALPAVLTWVDAAPPEVDIIAAIETSYEGVEALPRTERPNLDWTWVAPAHNLGEALAKHLQRTARLDKRTFFWGAGERSLVKYLRIAKNNLQIPRGHHHTQFYWIQGRTLG